MKDNLTPEFSEMLFPSKKINPREKDREWHRKFAEGAYAYYHGNAGGLWGLDYQGTIDLLRRYGDGDQPVSIYQDIILGKKKFKQGDNSSLDTNKAKGMIENARRNYTNINWQIFSFAPKFMRLIKRSVADVNHDVDCNLLDEKSVDEKKMIKARLLIKSFMKEHDAKMSAAGFELTTKEYVPSDLEEINWLESIGAMKLAFETQTEDIIDKSFAYGRWDQDIKNRLIEDFVNLNCGIVKDVVDKATGAIVPKYVDPKYFVAEYNRSSGFSKSRWMGEIELITIEEIGESGEFTIDELESIARKNCGHYGNITAAQFDQRVAEVAREEVASNKWFYSMLVPVLKLEFKDINCEYKTTKQKASGEQYFTSDFGKEYNSETKRTEVMSFHVLRKCSLIIGTEYCYDWGLCDNMKRPNKKEVKFSYSPFVIPGKSLTAQCMPIYDEMELNYLSKQNALSKAAPPGIAVNTSAIANVKLGNKKMSEWDHVQYYVQSGNYFYNGLDMPGNSTKPFEQLQGGLKGQLNEFILNHQQIMADLREMLGITLPASASGDGKQFGLGVAKLQIDTANDALFELVESYGFLKEDCAQSIFHRFISLLKDDGNKAKYGNKYPISAPDKIVFDAFGDDVAMKIQMRLNKNTERKERILMAATESLKAGKNGQPGITQSEFGFIEEMLERGETKKANMFLARCESKRREQARAEALENIKVQNEGQMAQSKQKAQSEMQKIVIKGDEDRKTLTHKENERIRAEKAISELTTIPEMEKEAALESKGVSIDKNS